MSSTYRTIVVTTADGYGVNNWEGPGWCNVINTQDGRIDISCITRFGRAVVKCTDSRCLETLTCQSENRCRRVNFHDPRTVVFDYSNVGRNAIVHYLEIHIHGNTCPTCFDLLWLRSYLGISYSIRHMLPPPGGSIYHPYLNAEVYRYSNIPALHIKMMPNNWITSYLEMSYWLEPAVAWAQSSVSTLISVPFSPELFMEIEYDEYRRSGLRNVVGWTSSSRGKVGWNADDILRVLKEEFSNRPWALFDDRSMVLYTNLLSPESIVHIKDVTRAERVEIIREGHHVLRIDSGHDLREE